MIQHTLIRDHETKSEIKLDKVGVHRYAVDPSTQVLCTAYCVDDGPIKLWHQGDPVPPEWQDAARNPDWRAVAHNVAFELAIERGILGPRHKFPLIPTERNICTMAAGMAMALPGKLELCAKALGLTERKDKDGRRAMLQLTKPRRARKNEDDTKIHWYDDELKREQVDQYCMQDVTIERELFNSLYLLSPEEFELWLLDQRINDRGFYIDHDLALASQKIINDAFIQLDQELNELTDGAVQTVNQVQEMKNWLSGRRIIAEDLDKETVELLLTSVKDNRARRLLELRQLGAHAAVKKVSAFLLRRAEDGRARGEFQFHAAGTGRWSSRGIQVQNLKRLPDNFKHDAAIRIISRGSLAQAKKIYPQPLKTIGLLMRPMIIAQEGHELWGADFSGIEARVTAWLAKQEDKLEVFRRYDRKEGPDPYIVTAANILKKPVEAITKEERQQYGKTSELAFGFAGGVGAFRKFSTEDFSDEEIIKFRDLWRDSHPNIRKFWYALNDCFWESIHHPGIRQAVNQRVEVVFDPDTFKLPVIWMTLPSGRQIAYPDAQVRRPSQPEGLNGFTSRGVYFKDNTQGRWRDVRVWPGLVTENVVQAVARDLLAEALKRLDAAGFKIVLHVHDEIVCEEHKGSNRFELFTLLMNTLPSWAAGLPLAAAAWRHVRYVK